MGYIVELAIKYADMRGNTTETVQAIIDANYGRNCTTAAPPELVRHFSVEEIAQKIYESRKHEALKSANKGSKGRKRKEAPQRHPEIETEHKHEQDQGITKTQKHIPDFTNTPTSKTQPSKAKSFYKYTPPHTLSASASASHEPSTPASQRSQIRHQMPLER